MNYWDVPITIGKRGRFWETVGALVSYLLSQYGGWIGNWETAGAQVFYWLSQYGSWIGDWETAGDALSLF